MSSKIEHRIYTMCMVQDGTKVLLINRPDKIGFPGYLAPGGKVDFPESYRIFGIQEGERHARHYDVLAPARRSERLREVLRNVPQEHLVSAKLAKRAGHDAPGIRLYWVMRDQRRIAGISLADHALGSAFVIPPFSVSEELVRFLTEYCLCMAGNLRRVEAYNVLPEQLSAYESAGFGKRSARKCMIRPTERLALPDVPGFVRVHPEERKHLRAIVELKKAAYRGGLN